MNGQPHTQTPVSQLNLFEEGHFKRPSFLSSLLAIGGTRSTHQPLLISHNSLFLQPFPLRPLSAEETSRLPGGLLWPAKGNAGTIGREASSAPKAGFRGYLETRGRIFSFIFAECKNTNSGYFITVACLDSFLG